MGDNNNFKLTLIFTAVLLIFNLVGIFFVHKTCTAQLTSLQQTIDTTKGVK